MYMCVSSSYECLFNVGGTYVGSMYCASQLKHSLMECQLYEMCVTVQSICVCTWWNIDIHYLWLEAGVIMREGGMEDEVIIADDMY